MINTSKENKTFKSYFDPTSKDEDYPLEINEERSLRSKKLEEIFNSVFDDSSNILAKVSFSYKKNSKEEREAKKIFDRSFVYGEIVIFFNFFRLLNHLPT